MLDIGMNPPDEHCILVLTCRELLCMEDTMECLLEVCELPGVKPDGVFQSLLGKIRRQAAVARKMHGASARKLPGGSEG